MVVSLTLKSMAMVMNVASQHIEAQTALKKSSADRYVGEIAAALAADGESLAAAYKNILGDVGTRVTDSVRDIAQ